MGYAPRPIEDRYRFGVKTAARSQGRDTGMGSSYATGPDPDAAHRRGMAEVAAWGRDYGPPAISQQDLQQLVSSTHADEAARWTPERMEQFGSYMGAQQSNDYGTYKRKIKAHRAQYGD